MLYHAFAGYGHRVSMSTADHGVQKFGGCWLPPSPHGRPMGQEEKENYIFEYSPPGIKEWVQACRRELGRTPQREDVVKSILDLELPHADAYPEIGLYTPAHSQGRLGEEAAACYHLDMSVPLSSSIATDFRRPPEPRTVARIGNDLDR